MWSNYKGEFTYYISFVLFLRLVMTHLIKLPTLLEIKFKRYILVVNIWIDWCWSSISGLSYNITRNYEVVIYGRKCSCWSMSVNFDESRWMWSWEYNLCFPEIFLKSNTIFSMFLYPHLNTLGWLFTQDLIQTTVSYARELISWNKCPSTVSFWPSWCCSLK